MRGRRRGGGRGNGVGEEVEQGVAQGGYVRLRGSGASGQQRGSVDNWPEGKTYCHPQSRPAPGIFRASA